MANCTHPSTLDIEVFDGQDDVVRTVCADPDCGFILRQVRIFIDANGEEVRRPKSIPADAQPLPKGSSGRRAVAVEDVPLSAQEMAKLAMRTREETTGKQVQEIVRKILAACTAHVLEGQHTETLGEAELPTEAILAAVLRELRGLGYKVRHWPEPGAGVHVEVKWPTAVRRGRKTTKKGPPPEGEGDNTESELTFGGKRDPDKQHRRQLRRQLKNQPH